MKTIKRTFLPEYIKYNKKLYIKGEKTDESIKVEVLNKNLKEKTDLYGHNYKPTVWYFNPVENFKIV